jgi:diadenosine tetraphosphate (Ap4A) HIT family hydrolase
VTVEGVELEVRWAAQKKKLTVAQQPSKRQRLTESEAKDSSTAYFKLLLPADEEFDVNEAAEVVRRWMERTLEDALAGDNDGEERVTAETEPALQVQVRVPETQSGGSRYGFLDFASHAAANMALATLTGSTDGGRVLEDAKVVPEKTVGQVYLHWAQARDVDPEKKARDLIEDASGFKFERKHFPADSRKDCWFCLASEDCEKHLITGVYNTCYAAMPKGPVHPGHVLLVPVQHGSQGALKDAAVAEEMEMLKSMLRKHASTEYDADLFVFERAIQTKGGYHTHVQCIPVERNLGWKLQKTLLSQGTKIGMDLREVNSDVGIRALLSGDDDGDDNGYFYAEIPIEGHEYKRFLCKQASGDSRRASVPLQFGREVLAAVVGKPELAHWKSCVTDREKEADDAARFRESFKKYNE